MNEEYVENILLETIKLARSNIESNNGGPFGAIVTKNGKMISQAGNLVTSTPDPTAHAEIVAIRRASQTLNNFDLSGCELFVSCEPCPMCLGAVYWARINKIYFAADRKDAAEVGFDDEFIYEEIQKSLEERQIPVTQMLQDEARQVLKEWKNKEDRAGY